MITEVANNYIVFDKKFSSFASDFERVNETSSYEILNKLRIVKSHTDFVIFLASRYSQETGKPFSQLLKAGLVALIKSTKEYYPEKHKEFGDYLRSNITNAILGFVEDK